MVIYGKDLSVPNLILILNFSLWNVGLSFLLFILAVSVIPFQGQELAIIQPGLASLTIFVQHRFHLLDSVQLYSNFGFWPSRGGFGGDGSMLVGW